MGVSNAFVFLQSAAPIPTIKAAQTVCLLPLAVVVFVLLHWLLWPLLSRLISPFSRYKIITNRKTLIAIGCLCMTFAFNLEHVGAKEVLKLLS